MRHHPAVERFKIKALQYVKYGRISFDNCPKTYSSGQFLATAGSGADRAAANPSEWIKRKQL